MTNRVEFNIDTSNIKEVSKRLERINRSALPAAIRQTLNNAAYDMKTRSLLKSAKENFTERQKNFFKANSRFFPTQERSNVDRMKSVVGMVEDKLHNKSKNYAVQDLEQQEEGGKIDSKTFIGMKPSRVGGKGVVRRQLTVKKIVDSAVDVKRISRFKGKGGESIRTRSEEQKFMVAAHVAGVGGFVKHRHKGKGIVWRVNSLNKKRLKLTPIYDYDKGRSITVKPKHFMKEAAYDTLKRIPRMYKREALRRIKRYLK